MQCECPEGSPQNAPEALCYVVSTVGLHVMAQEVRCTLPGSYPGIAEGTRTVPGGPLARSAKARGVIDTIVECVSVLLPSCPGMRGGGKSCPCATNESRLHRRSSLFFRVSSHGTGPPNENFQFSKRRRGREGKLPCRLRELLESG